MDTTSTPRSYSLTRLYAQLVEDGAARGGLDDRYGAWAG